MFSEILIYRQSDGHPVTFVSCILIQVDDFALYRFFTGRYTSVKCAKVVLDESGFSKGYGFVR